MLRRALLAGACLAALACPAAAQGTVAGTGMHYNNPDKVARFPAPLLYGAARLWDTSYGGVGESWMSVETARGVYLWTALDAMVALYKAQGLLLNYTFGNVPAWSHVGDSNRGDPPTDMQDARDFMTSIFTRYAGRINFYEPLNEPGSLFWTPENGNYTLSAISLAWLQWFYPALKAIDPNAQVLSPSFVGPQGIFQSDSYYAQGGCALSDAHAMHAYPISTFYAQATEQMLQQDHLIRQTMAAYSCPHGLQWTEGDYSSQTTAPALVQAFSAIWPLLAASDGIALANWYVFDSPVATNYGRLTDGGVGLNAAGAAYTEALKWVVGATWTSPIARTPGANTIRNPNASGSVVGGAVGTHWLIYNPDSSKGISTSITGTSAGLDLRVFGTATTGAGGYIRVDFENNSVIPAVLGQYVDVSANLLLPLGVRGGLARMEIGFDQYNSGGGYITAGIGADFPIYGTLGFGNDYHVQSPVTSATTASVVPEVGIYYPVGVPVDFTVRINTTSCDSGSIYSGTFTKPGGYIGQVVWDGNNGPSSYIVPAGYTYTRDWTGRQTAVTPGQTITLTRQPILLENQRWAMWVH